MMNRRSAPLQAIAPESPVPLGPPELPPLPLQTPPGDPLRRDPVPPPAPTPSDPAPAPPQRDPQPKPPVVDPPAEPVEPGNPPPQIDDPPAPDAPPEIIAQTVAIDYAAAQV